MVGGFLGACLDSGFPEGGLPYLGPGGKDGFKWSRLGNGFGSSLILRMRLKISLVMSAASWPG